LRNDAATKRVYVGCGDDEKNGAIATVDAMTNQRLDEEYKIGAEPESFQLEDAGPNIYVSIPDLQQIAVINREAKKITRWPLTGLRKNFPWHSTRRSPPIRRHARTGSVPPVSHPLLKLSSCRPAAEHLPTSQMKWQHPGQMLEIFSCFFSKPHLLHLLL